MSNFVCLCRMNTGESSDKACETLLSQKEKIILLHNGFTMHKNKNCGKAFYWECRQRHHKKNGSGDIVKCPARCKTNEKDGKHYLASTSEHNHAPIIGEKICLQNSEFLKDKATSSNDINHLKSFKLQRRSFISTTSINSLPTVNAMKKIINRKRRHDLPTEPANLEDVFIPDKLKNTISQQLFLQYETNLDFTDDKATSDSDKEFLGFSSSSQLQKFGNILIFCTIENLRYLGQAKYFIIDGTFKTSPSLYYQIYTIQYTCTSWCK